MPASLNQHLQDCAIRLAITDGQFLRLVVGRIEPKHFTSTITDAFARICFDYFLQFGEAPGDHFQDELAHYLEDRPEEEIEQCARYADKLEKMDTPNRDFVLRRVDSWAKQRERESAVLEAADLLAAGEIEKADNVLYKALQSGIPERDVGLRYLTDLSNLIEREHSDPFLPTGVRALDRIIGGFDRGQLVTTLGGYKAGKSWWLTHLGQTAMLRGLTVVHVSHELSMAEQEMRYDMMFAKRGLHKHAGTTRKYYRWDGKDILEKKVRVLPLSDSSAIARTRRHARRFGGKLFVKKYPMGSCKPGEIERYLNYLEAYEGVTADVLILDYLDIMDLSGFSDELRHQLNSGYKWLKGLADDRQMVVATVSQVTRAALKKRHPSMKDVAEDARKAGNVDIMLAIGRGDEEVRCNLAGLSVLANRNGPQDSSVTVSLCYEIGQFCLSSWPSGRIDDMVRDLQGHDDDDIPDATGD